MIIPQRGSLYFRGNSGSVVQFRPMSQTPPDRSSLDKGELAEALVAQWLIEQGWEILDRRWKCRLGELDLVAYRRSHLIFVEVKARSSGNWDADGMLAVNAQKQAKLWRSVGLFLADRPHLANLPCSFDVALVHCRKGGRETEGAVEIGEGKAIGGYTLTIQQYIPAAFDFS
jgi:putative endonuclease